MLQCNKRAAGEAEGGDRHPHTLQQRATLFFMRSND
jgi:hypothetical protein